MFYDWFWLWRRPYRPLQIFCFQYKGLLSIAVFTWLFQAQLPKLPCLSVWVWCFSPCMRSKTLFARGSKEFRVFHLYRRRRRGIFSALLCYCQDAIRCIFYHGIRHTRFLHIRSASYSPEKPRFAAFGSSLGADAYEVKTTGNSQRLLHCGLSGIDV